MNKGIRIRILLSVSFLLTVFAACGEKSSPTCLCTTNADCGDGWVCTGCRCVERCDVSGECPADTPNCNPETGLCEPPCPEYDCPDDRPNCGGDGVCFGPCTSGDDCTNPDYPNCGPDGLCFAPCTSREDCTHPDNPNCDPATGVCFGPCPDHPCPADLPNCGEDGLCFARCDDAADCPPSMPNCDTMTGICFGPCSTNDDCTDPANPNCDPATGLCQGRCPDVPCPEGMVNCDADGKCFGPCTSSADCTHPDFPNCGPDGVCFPPCEDDDDCIHPDRPNCDASSGLCFGPCTTNDDCIDPDLPNCGPDGECFGPCTANGDCINENFPNCNSETGICFGPCTSHDNCIDPSQPNCDLDPGSTTSGLCLPPCLMNDDCLSALYPNCDPTPGVCLPPCSADGDCPEEAWKCDTSSGLCFLPGCVIDSDCSPPDTVCEEWFCVPGCDEHGDCAPGERCNLIGPDNIYHCEPRDCLIDADCTFPGTVCDTDGLADPDGGGYCVDGCESFYDCRRLGYDCEPSTGRCAARDYGDIGEDCATGCDSGFCLADEGNVCSDFCCKQHDCPEGWVCRPRDDGTGGDRTVDVCVPIALSQGTRRYNEICSRGSDCRSNVCSGSRCRETCCTDEDCDAPFVSGMYCTFTGIADVTACFVEPTIDNDPLGAPGCMTSGGSGDCRSDLCFAFYHPDTGCLSDADCTPDRPTCWDLMGDGTTDCVHDFCVDHCCSADDCPDYGSDIFACSKWLFGTSDFNICLLHDGPAALLEGQACTMNSECRSMVCSDSTSVCRRRCCTDEDCTNLLYPNCGLEANHIFSNPRLLNVCLP